MRRVLLLFTLLFVLSCAASRISTLPSTVFSAVAQNFLPVEPGRIQVDIWYETAACLGISSPPSPWSLSWAVADEIFIPTDSVSSKIFIGGYLAYGMTTFNSFGSPGLITIERAHWWNPAIISHESIHALTSDFDHDGPEWTCETPSLLPLPYRVVRRPRDRP